MAEKLTYQKLEQKVKKLQEEIIRYKKTEEALKESEKEYRLLVKNLPGVVYRGYKDWSVDFIDKKIEWLIGYDVEEFNSKKMIWSAVMVKEDIEAAKDCFIKALKSDRSYVREYRIKSKAGDTYWIQERGQIICDDRGEIEYVNGVFFDITDLKQAEQALRRERDKLEAALSEVKTLSGMLPICSHCKNVRDDKGYWDKIETYIGKKTGADFSHGICPECADKYYPEYDLYGEDDEM